MTPKFKVGDLVKSYYKNHNEIIIEQIIKIENNQYFVKDIFSNIILCFPFFNYERETFDETSPELLTDEEKLEML